jgi:hypothetical protein
MKVIFLDHDGVICLRENWGGRGKKWSEYLRKNPKTSRVLSSAPVDVRFDNFDNKSVKVLNSILSITDAEIVVSSDWRVHATLEELGEYYISQGIIKKPIGYTPTSLPGDLPYFFDDYDKTELEQTRSYEILEWLKEHPEVTHWVAVDDLDMSVRSGKWGLTNFVLTPRGNEGIKQSGIKEKIISFLHEKDSH